MLCSMCCLVIKHLDVLYLLIRDQGHVLAPVVFAHLLQSSSVHICEHSTQSPAFHQDLCIKILRKL